MTQKQLDEIQYLMDHALRGFHILFESHLVRQAFPGPDGFHSIPEMLPEMGEKTYDSPEDDPCWHLEQLFAQSSLAEKQFYLDSLSHLMLLQVVRAYFEVVLNNALEGTKLPH